MSSLLLPSGIADICKWCGLGNADVGFENANLCNKCQQKATLAIQNPKLCETCKSLMLQTEVRRELLTEYGFKHNVATRLRVDAENGCGLCRIFLLQDPNTDSGRIQSIPLYLTAGTTNKTDTEDESSDILSVDINSLYFSSEPDQFNLTLSVSAAANDPAAKYISQRPLERDLGSANTIQQIKNWLNECLTKHHESYSLKGETSSRGLCLPTRVIDVGVRSESEVRTFETSSTVHEQYIALSYCWGTQPFITSTLANIESHRLRLEFATLPQTFKDAIRTTRDLGFRYLWIDALCIIQDSTDDKLKEIGAMEGIYSNSTLTIAVVGASGVTEGYLKPKVQLTVEIPYLGSDGTTGVVQISPQRTVDLWQEPLYTRAWCLQENLLSPRLLLYTDTEVVWQCQSTPVRRPGTTHVSYIRDDPNLGASPFQRIPVGLSTAAKDANFYGDSSPDALSYRTWRNTVQNYTRRRLTVPSDRLPALAGIAQKFRHAWDDVYYAGLWKRQFIPSLTWRRSDREEGPHVRYSPLNKYRAPSWSWASIDGPVEFDFRFDIGNLRGLQAKLISCEVTPISDQAPLGEVESGKLVLEASLIPAGELSIRTSYKHGSGSDEFRNGGSVFLDDHPRDTWPRFADVLDEDMRQNGWCMLLGEGNSGSGKMTETTELLLMPVDDDTFKRIGFYRSSVKGASKAWVSGKNRRLVTII